MVRREEEVTAADAGLVTRSIQKPGRDQAAATAASVVHGRSVCTATRGNWLRLGFKMSKKIPKP